jgi:transcriptional regulator with XRE-family HTH domain
MIKNERQYRITKAQADKFAHALAALPTAAASAAENGSGDGSVHPLLLQAQRDALQSQHDDLCRELAEYEALRSGKQTVLEVNSWAELPQALIRARIGAGLSQKDLAERLGLKEQQIQRYESTSYSGASFERLSEIIQALGLTVREEVFLPGAQVSLKTLSARLKQIGLDQNFVRRRLLPAGMEPGRQQNGAKTDGSIDGVALSAAAQVGRIFGWTPAAIFGTDPLTLSAGALATARLKVSGQAKEGFTTAYAVYAHYLAQLLLDATAHLTVRPLPSGGREVYEAVRAAYGAVTFPNVLRYIWSLGIPVLPLRDSGAFHGACWRNRGRHVLVLKQKTGYPARWLNDALHELGHTLEEPEQEEFTIIEQGDSFSGHKDTPEEKAAVAFATEAALGGRAETLTQQCVTLAKNSVERLKEAVLVVAEREGVPVDTLANYVAYRLSLQNIKWWGAANNLQPAGHDPWQVARDVLLEYTDFGALNEVDRELLRRALSETEA